MAVKDNDYRFDSQSGQIFAQVEKLLHIETMFKQISIRQVVNMDFKLKQSKQLRKGETLDSIKQEDAEIHRLSAISFARGKLLFSRNFKNTKSNNCFGPPEDFPNNAQYRYGPSKVVTDAFISVNTLFKKIILMQRRKMILFTIS